MFSSLSLLGVLQCRNFNVSNFFSCRLWHCMHYESIVPLQSPLSLCFAFVFWQLWWKKWLMQRVPQVMLDVNPHLILQCIWALECTLCTNKKGEQLFCVQSSDSFKHASPNLLHCYITAIYSSCINSPPPFPSLRIKNCSYKWKIWCSLPYWCTVYLVLLIRDIFNLWCTIVLYCKYMLNLSVVVFTPTNFTNIVSWQVDWNTVWNFICWRFALCGHECHTRSHMCVKVRYSSNTGQ